MEDLVWLQIATQQVAKACGDVQVGNFRITLWKINITIEHDLLIVDLTIKVVIFHSYVSLQEGIH